LNKLLLRGCNTRPHGRDIFWWKHMQDRNRPQQHRVEIIARHTSKRSCILMVTSVTSKSSLKGFVAGSQPALSKQKCWPNILPPKLTKTFGEKGSAELKPAPRNGQALDHAGRGLSWCHGIVPSLDRKAFVGSTRRVVLVSFLLSPSPVCSWILGTLLDQNYCRNVFILLFNVPTHWLASIYCSWWQLLLKIFVPWQTGLLRM
jgi:hypothetical protein